MKPTNIELQLSIKKMADFLRSLYPDKPASHAEIMVASGISSRQYSYGIKRAREILKPFGIVIKSVPGKGYRRQINADILHTHASHRKHVSTTSLNVNQLSVAVMANANDLSQDTKKKIWAEQSALGVIRAFCREDRVKKITDSEPQRKLTSRETFDAFMNSGPRKKTG